MAEKPRQAVYGIEIVDPTKHKVFDKLINIAKDLLRQDYGVDAERAKKYCQYDRRDIPSGVAEYLIPIGSSDSILYKGDAIGGTIDRDKDDYMRKALYGVDLANFFASGNLVVDLGSGRAISLMEISQEFPEAVIIGMDFNYQEKRRIKYNKPGLQLTWSDWADLSGLKDNSVNNFISVEGVITWGIPGIAGRKFEEYIADDWRDILNELYRTLKVGGEIRLSGSLNVDEYDLLAKEFDQTKWRLESKKTLIVAKKIS